jgi:tRNA threonylcarbamoyladenosine biosynthesis protein TsaB
MLRGYGKFAERYGRFKNAGIGHRYLWTNGIGGTGTTGLTDVGAIAAVSGPGSFTGVRVGLSAVKGLAEVSRIPVVAVSRLEVLAAKAGVEAAALDAHRAEVFLRIGRRVARGVAAGPVEILAGASELKTISPAPVQAATCDEAAAALLKSAWPSTELLHAVPPTAADALRLAASRLAEGAFVDLALLDGNYLRRSDAEIFGEVTEAQRG